MSVVGDKEELLVPSNSAIEDTKYGERTWRNVWAHSSPANGILGLPEDTDDFFSKISIQLFRLFNMITRLPSTVTELTDPITV